MDFGLAVQDAVKADTEAEEFVSGGMDEEEAESAEGNNLHYHCERIEFLKFIPKTVLEEIYEPGLSEAEGDISTYEAISSAVMDEEGFGKILWVCLFLKAMLIIKFQKHMKKNCLRNCWKKYRKVKKL